LHFDVDGILSFLSRRQKGVGWTSPKSIAIAGGVSDADPALQTACG
jgi:hypothetical protein